MNKIRAIYQIITSDRFCLFSLRNISGAVTGKNLNSQLMEFIIQEIAEITGSNDDEMEEQISRAEKEGNKL